MKSDFLNETFSLIDAQRKEIMQELEKLTASQIWEKPSKNEWSIGHWLEHLYKTIRLQRRGISIYVYLATPIAKLFVEKPYETSIEDLFETKPHSVPNPFFGIRPNRFEKRKVSLQEMIDLLEIEKEKLKTILRNKDEAVLGHIKLYEGPFGFVNMLQSIKLIQYHERNDFKHIKSIIKVINCSNPQVP